MNENGESRGASGSGEGADTFERWYREHHDRLLAQCSRMLRDRAAAEDVAQETLLRAWLGRERMREEDLGAWLSVVARNLCISHIRKLKKAVPTEILPETPDEGADPAHVVERLESRRAVRRALRKVGGRHGAVLFRREIEGVDYEELGEELGLTPAGTRTVMFRARKMLRDRLVAAGEGVGLWIAGVRVRASEATRRLRVSLGSLEGSMSQMLQAGATLALVGGVALSGVSAMTPGHAQSKLDSVRPGASIDAISMTPRSSTSSPSTTTPRAFHVGGGGGLSDRGIKPTVRYNPDNHDKDIGVQAGPVDEHNYSHQIDDGKPCITCTPEAIVFGVACSQDPRICDP